MTAFSEFDPAEPVGPGRTVIEASAGTGKTFTISAVVARLIAEEGIGLDEILVVTFTRAATAELRARVRERLVETRRALLDPATADRHDQHLVALLDSQEPEIGEADLEPRRRRGELEPRRRRGEDPHLAALLAATVAEFDEGELEPRRRRAIARLGEALTHFDRAQIFTIHGFAQRLLSRLGLRARLSPDIEPGAVDDLLLTQTAGDLIVGRYADHPEDVPVGAGDIINIGRVVVEKPDARIVPDAATLDGTARARVEFAHRMRIEVQRRMQLSGVATFDDGLAEVRDTLADPEVGAAARALLQRHYRVALVDESQDTDPTQWQVIRAVFDDSRLVVIGDPKQSIYSFRGADVESYLSALDGAQALRTLATNWRSDGPLIAGLDVLFGGAEFGDPRIAYHRVRPAPGHEPARIHGIGPPLSIRRFAEDIEINRRKTDGCFYIDDARKMVAADVGSEIVRLLTAGVTVDGEDGAGPLRPDHIAVLCRTNKQVAMVRDELYRRSVPSVAARTGGVFTSPAAGEWRRLLLGVERPEQAAMVRLAATSLPIGKSPQEVAALSEEEVLDLQQQFRHWQEILHGDGVPALVGEINRAAGLAERVLARPDGERLMTDFIHIAEEMHAVWRRRRTGSLVAWLEATGEQEDARATNNVEEPESRQRRLETDADAVQVQTIHSAKGLQWPVVLVPYAWDVPDISPSFPVFHDPDAPTGGTPRPRLVNVAGKGTPGFAEHADLATEEDVGEEGRLLYVALTRPQHHLLVWWVENSINTPNSKLHELITRNDRTPADLVAASEGTIEMPVLAGRPPVEQYRPATSAPTTLERARFERTLDYDWRRASFTSLSPEHPLGSATETFDIPLRTDEIAADEPGTDPPAAGPVLPMADLPRGARFGTLVHHVFEAVRFDAPDLAGAIREALAPELRHADWDFAPEALVEGLVAAMTTPLGPEPDAPRLRDLDPDRVLDELTFEFPVRTGAGTVSLADIGSVMIDHLPDTDPYRPYAASLRESGGQRFRGFLTGAIDLTAALTLSDGDRYVVIDYKSNAMPARNEVAAPHDYGPGPLAAAMIDGNYVLQATLYQVALHRYLQWRLRDYDPAHHLGGAMYLFVRGMAGADAPVIGGERCGVARWRPPVSMVVALSELFAGSSP